MQLRLIKLANHLDNIGLHEEADYLDQIISDLTNEPIINKLSSKLMHSLEYANKLENRVIELEEVIKLASSPYSN